MQSCTLDKPRRPFDPEVADLANGLKSARSSASVTELHNRILQGKHNENVFLANTVVQSYGKCGDVGKARAVFDAIQKPNVFSWTIMLSAYTQNGYLSRAREWFEMMPVRDAFSWNIMLSAYAQEGHINDAERTFQLMPVKSVVAWTAMLTAYARQGDLQKSKDWFDRMPERNQVSWGALISAYTRYGNLEQVKSLFDSLENPSSEAYNCMITAYAKAGDLHQAERMFDLMPEKDVIARTTMIQAFSHNDRLEDAERMFRSMQRRDVMAWNIMITAYAHHGDVGSAKRLFDEMPVKSPVSWNVMVSAFTLNGKHKESVELVHRMKAAKVKVSEITYFSALGACAEAGDLSQGRALHREISKSGLDRDERISVSLIDMYGKCRSIGEAVETFGGMNHHDVAAWTALISAYGLNEQRSMAFGAFARMDLEGVEANMITFITVLDACMGMAALKHGKLVHAEVVEAGYKSHKLDTALVQMYGKCGSPESATWVFEQMQEKDIALYSSMLSTYAQGGEFSHALRMFGMISLDGHQPDGIVFVTILSVCSHAGLFDRGREIFTSMKQDFGAEPSVDHYSCMVDLLSRSGQLEVAEELVTSMPFVPDAAPWTMLLDASKANNKSNSSLSMAVLNSMDLEPGSSAPYVFLSNVNI